MCLYDHEFAHMHGGITLVQAQYTCIVNHQERIEPLKVAQYALGITFVIEDSRNIE